MLRKCRVYRRFMQDSNSSNQDNKSRSAVWRAKFLTVNRGCCQIQRFTYCPHDEGRPPYRMPIAWSRQDIEAIYNYDQETYCLKKGKWSCRRLLSISSVVNVSPKAQVNCGWTDDLLVVPVMKDGRCIACQSQSQRECRL